MPWGPNAHIGPPEAKDVYKRQDYVTYIGTTPVDSDTVAIEVTEAQLKPAGKTAATLDRDTKSNGGANVGDILMNNNTQGYLKLNANATYQLSPMRQWLSLIHICL